MHVKKIYGWPQEYSPLWADHADRRYPIFVESGALCGCYFRNPAAVGSPGLNLLPALFPGHFQEYSLRVGPGTIENVFSKLSQIRKHF